VRILWHSNSPDATSGYGVQTALFVPRIAAMGHEVAISADTRVNLPPTTWNGHMVYPAGIYQLGADTLPWHYQDHGADLLITLADMWQYDPAAVTGCNTSMWMPIDCDPLGNADRAFMENSGADPIAMSRHGQRMLENAGRIAPYIPHGVDTAVFHAGIDRDAARAELGIESWQLAIGINAQNTPRKAIVQSLAGFARFARDNPAIDPVLLLHTTSMRLKSPDLLPVVQQLGILPRVRWAAHYAVVTSRIPAADMARWYSALDVLLACSMGEGFGIPIIESMACGTPVIGTNCSTMPELIPHLAGRLVGGVQSWDPVHQAWWVLPDPLQIALALKKVSVWGSVHRKAAADWGAQFDADRIARECWAPWLKEKEAQL
jgi:glycosyltransferase involved in cell wall biosynthesis